MYGTFQDLKYGLRILVRNPSFTVTAVLSLALGIGANTAIFSIVNGILLRPLPVTDPDRLVNIYTSFEHGSSHAVTSLPDYQDLEEGSDVFSEIAAFFYIPVSVKAGGSPEVVLGATVTSNYFDVLGVQAAVGRTFASSARSSSEDQQVAVISYRLWRNDFGSDPGILGRSVLVNSLPFTVVGVAPKGFTSTTVSLGPDVWVPLDMAPQVLPVDLDLHDRDERWLRLVARLRSGVTLDQARAGLSNQAARLYSSRSDIRFVAMPTDRGRFMDPGSRRGIAVAMSLLMGVVGLVLLIACSNVAHLQLARAVGREREIAMRRTLGGSRSRIMRQLLTESLLLSLVAGAAGVLLAAGVLHMLSRLQLPVPIPLVIDLGIDRTVLLFTLSASSLTGVLLGLLPALRAVGPDPFVALRGLQSGISIGPHRSRLQSSLVAAQISLSLVLVISAALCIKALHNTFLAAPGFDVHNGLVADLNLAHGQYDENRARAFLSQLLDEVEALPGVESASLAYHPPLTVFDVYSVSVEGYEAAPGESMTFDGNVVGSGFFETSGVPILHGRGIDDSDSEHSAPVAVVNETFAERFWPDELPLGKTIRIRDRQRRVIGVAKDSKYRALSEEPRPYVYLALSQHHVSMISLLVRTSFNPDFMVEVISKQVQKLDPTLPVHTRTVPDLLSLSRFPATMVSVLVGSFAFLALVLALVGVYGVMLYSVRQRRHELGIRVALGAEGGNLLRVVLQRGLVIIVWGIGLGSAGAFFVSRMLSSVLYGVRPIEPAILVLGAAALSAAALLACFLPAWRESRMNPATALRCD